MIITLITVVLLAVGITLYIEKKKIEDYYTRNVIDSLAFALTAVGTIMAFFVFGILIGNISTQEVNYQNALYKKEMLEYRSEHMEDNITGNEMLYNDIVEFNNELRSTKKWADNPWTSWFNNQDIATIDYIELDDM